MRCVFRRTFENYSAVSGKKHDEKVNGGSVIKGKSVHCSIRRAISQRTDKPRVIDRETELSGTLESPLPTYGELTMKFITL